MAVLHMSANSNAIFSPSIMIYYRWNLKTHSGKKKKLPQFYQRLVLILFFFCIFSELHIEDDPTSIFLSARALISLQKLYGLIPKVYGKGNNAKKLWDLLKTMGKEELTPNAMGKSSIDQLIIIDRSIDLMSVLATQLTYEGLIGI